MRQLGAGLLALVLTGAASMVAAAEPADSGEPLELSPETRELLRSEMREITRAMEDLIPAIVAGRWDDTTEISAHIAASFVLKQELSAAQRAELEKALPERFKRLDARFHADASKLSEAARQRDSELVTFRLYQLLTGCTSCHAEYAQSAFPGFAPGGKAQLPK